MKFLTLLFLFFTLFIYQCNSVNKTPVNSIGQNQKESNQNINAMNSSNNQIAKNETEVFSYSGKSDDLQYQFKGTLQKKGKYNGVNYLNDNLVISYTVKNTGAKEYFIFNQGYSHKKGTDIVFVEPQTDGIIELSQRMFQEPTDKMCPTSYVPIMPKYSLLKGDSETANEVLVELPLKINHPFDNCTPINQMPKTSDKVKFCIGIAEKKLGITNSIPDFSSQKLLCSDYFAIK